jgi:N-acetylmuramoyl-L-alanine amidase
MNYSAIKRIGRIALIGSILYFLHTKELIAPEYKPIAIESRKPLIERKVIVLDPGHGISNKESGKMDYGGARYQDYREVYIVMKQAKDIKELLDSTRYKVILTRKDNYSSCPLESRPKLANEINADLFVSLHINRNRQVRNIRGFEIYYRNSKSKKFANSMVKNLETMTPIPKNWVKRENYKVLKNLNCPGILIESGYLQTKKDREPLLQEYLSCGSYILSPSDTLPGITKAIAKTIEDYLK